MRAVLLLLLLVGVEAEWNQSLLALALEPHTLEDFLLGSAAQPQVFERQIKAFGGRGPDHFKSVGFGSQDVLDLLDTSVSVVEDREGEQLLNQKDYRLVKRVKGKDGEWWSGGVPGDHIPAEKVPHIMNKGGFTLVFNNVDLRHRGLAKLAEEMENELGYTVQFNSYLTPPSSQGFEVHWDPMETLVLQLEGQKSWQIYDPIIPLPRPEQRFKPLSTQISFGSLQEVWLEEGSALYLPRGWLHEATTNKSETKGQGSLHLTVGIDAQMVTWEYLQHSAIKQLYSDYLLNSSAPQPQELTETVSSFLHLAVRGLALSAEGLRGSVPWNFVLNSTVDRGCVEALDLLRGGLSVGFSAEGLKEPTHEPLESDDLPSYIRRSPLFDQWSQRVKAGLQIEEMEDVFAWIRGQLETLQQRQQLCVEAGAKHLAEVERKLSGRQARRRRCLMLHGA